VRGFLLLWNKPRILIPGNSSDVLKIRRGGGRGGAGWEAEGSVDIEKKGNVVEWEV